MTLSGTGLPCNILLGSSAVRSGGGIDANKISLFIVESANLRRNQAWSGDSIFSRLSTTRAIESVFLENSMSTSQKIGGAILSLNNTLEFDACSLISNYGIQGGGIMCAIGGNIVARGGSLVGNNSTR